MTFAAVSSRLRYLDAAATRFATTAPTVAAGLRTHSNRLADDGHILLATPKQIVCGACGSLLVPAVSCTKTVEAQVNKSIARASKVRTRIAKDTSKANPTKVIVYTCSRCSRNTRVPIGQPPQRKQTAVLKTEEKPEVKAPISASSSQRLRNDIGKPALVDDATAVASQTQVSAKGKQRAKTKKQSALQALLAKNKANATAAASPAFDLMDFMKTS